MRKYRPKRFDQVLGQEVIVQTLQNALRKNKLAHAYLFSGSHGTGKTTLARLFAKALNCLHLEEYEPCNQCAHCREIDTSSSLDVLEIDGASHRGIEDIRKINETCSFIPSSGAYKIYLIDEVHMLTKEAFNALLKTLEEPPNRVKFFFATTEAHRIPATIVSRCQHFHLKRIASEKIVEKLAMIAKEQKRTVDPRALTILARYAKGGMRDAEALFDQLLVFDGGNITEKSVQSLLGLAPKELLFQLDEAIISQNYPTIFSITEEMIHSGRSLIHFLQELNEHFRTHLLMKENIAPLTLEYEKHNPRFTSFQLLQMLDLLHEAEKNLLASFSDKIWLEHLLFSLMKTTKKLSLENLVEKLLALEERVQKTVSESKKDVLHESESQKIASISVPENTIPIAPQPPEKIVIEEKKSKNLLEQKKSFTTIENPETQKNTNTSSPPLPASGAEGVKNSLPKKDKSRYDTIMRFAAKELNGSLKMEP